VVVGFCFSADAAQRSKTVISSAIKRDIGGGAFSMNMYGFQLAQEYDTHRI
jgi:hypothetical protein